MIRANDSLANRMESGLSKESMDRDSWFNESPDGMAIRHLALELKESGLGWKQVLIRLKKTFRHLPNQEVHGIWSDVKAAFTQGPNHGPDISMVKSAEKTNTQLPSAVPSDLGISQIVTISVVPQEISPDNEVAEPNPTGEPISEKHPIDDAWLGLSYLVGELKRRWYHGNLGDLGLWRARGEPGLKPGSIPDVKAFVSQGGHGDFLLEKPSVEQFMKARGLDPDRVLVDLWDRGILDGDAGHVTRVRVIKGIRRRVLVLPDVFVVRRSPKYLPAALRKKHGRLAHGRVAA